jgi:drug/metabolite transporter (DMT)-like permease
MTPPTRKQQTIAVLQALLVTFLWSTSWVLIKFGLDDIPALTFAGMRYTLAFIILLVFFLRSGQLQSLSQLTRRQWLMLVLLGVVYYAITQGTQFLGLKLLPAITFSLMLNLSAPLVALFSIPMLKEPPTRLQWIGIAFFLVGVAVYFYPTLIPEGRAIGMLVGISSVVATSLGSIIGRSFNRTADVPPLTVTVVSMGIGAFLLLATGLAVEPVPNLGWQQWGIVLWLAVVNTAFAFTLWNRTLQVLSATESTIINNTMLVQIAVLAWLFLGERPGVKEIIGMVIVLGATVLVNWRPKREEKTDHETSQS